MSQQQRLVMELGPKTKLLVQTLRGFLAECDKHEIGPRAEVELGLEGIPLPEDTEVTLFLRVDLPNKTSDLPGRVRRVVKKRKLEVAVEEQIAARKKARKSGEQVPGHVPPVKGTVRRVRRRKKT